jgi:protein phosphatase
VQIIAATDVGLVRKRNEDYFMVSEPQAFVVICDGMGGHPGGDVASRMTAEEVHRVVTGGEHEGPKIQAGFQEVQPFATLISAIFSADNKLRKYGDRNPQFQGMGTTIVALQEHEGSVCIAHVGDSRVYSFRARRLDQITRDHSVVATNPEYAHFAGMRNILTRAMGVGDDLEVDFVIYPAKAGETFLLCTDGLHNFVSEARIVEILGSSEPGDVRVNALIEEAKKGGGGDNITLSLAMVDAAVTKPNSRRLRGVARKQGTDLSIALEPEA